MKKILKAVMITAIIMMYGTGCATHMVMEESKKRVSYKRAVARGDDAAVRAIDLGGGGMGIGIDVGNWEALKERPWLQMGAALLDAGLIYGGYQVARELQDDGDSGNGGNGHNTAGGDNNVINGNGNTINTGDSIADGESTSTLD